MIPVVTPSEMAAIDAAAPEPTDVLIARAGAALALRALRLLGGAYGRRIVVVAGRGNNGNDGRVAAGLLARRGVAVTVLAPGDEVPARLLGRADLAIDAAFGTGFVDRGGWRPPAWGRVPVLAVDIPSGVNGLTGEAVAGVPRCLATVTFAAPKPGLLLPPGRALTGQLDVADIGLDCSRARAWWVTPADLAAWLPERPGDSHKWRSACWVVAGSPGMTGAAHLAARAAQRCGAGYVRLSSPGVDDDPGRPTEAVGVALPGEGWDEPVLAGVERFRSLVVGPGLGRSPGQLASVLRVAALAPVPLVIDGDGLAALAAWSRHDATATRRAAGAEAAGADGAAAATAGGASGIPDGGWPAPRVLTPHDGEYRLLTGHPPGPDRLEAARRLADRLAVVVLLKGPTTIVAEPGGQVLLATEGDARLASAGTGDVLAGIIGALLAQGMPAARAAAAGAVLHGLAARLGPARGLVAGDLPDLLPAAMARLATAGRADLVLAPTAGLRDDREHGR